MAGLRSETKGQACMTRETQTTCDASEACAWNPVADACATLEGKTVPAWFENDCGGGVRPEHRIVFVAGTWRDCFDAPELFRMWEAGHWVCAVPEPSAVPARIRERAQCPLPFRFYPLWLAEDIFVDVSAATRRTVEQQWRAGTRFFELEPVPAELGHSYRILNGMGAAPISTWHPVAEVEVRPLDFARYYNRWLRGTEQSTPGHVPDWLSAQPEAAPLPPETSLCAGADRKTCATLDTCYWRGDETEAKASKGGDGCSAVLDWDADDAWARHCDNDVDVFSQQSPAELRAENEPLLTFLVGNKHECIGASALIRSWDERTGWNWGNCRFRPPRRLADGTVIEEVIERSCRKFYKLPLSIGTFHITAAAADFIDEAFTTHGQRLFVLKPSALYPAAGVRMGRGEHYMGEISTPNEVIYDVAAVVPEPWYTGQLIAEWGADNLDRLEPFGSYYDRHLRSVRA